MVFKDIANGTQKLDGMNLMLLLGAKTITIALLQYVT